MPSWDKLIEFVKTKSPLVVWGAIAYLIIDLTIFDYLKARAPTEVFPYLLALIIVGPAIALDWIATEIWKRCLEIKSQKETTIAFRRYVSEQGEQMKLESLNILATRLEEKNRLFESNTGNSTTADLHARGFIERTKRCQFEIPEYLWKVLTEEWSADELKERLKQRMIERLEKEQEAKRQARRGY